METITVTKEGTTLSALLARHYRRVFKGAVERVHALNQDLSREGAFLPVGRSIVVPPFAVMMADETAPTPVVDLFA